MWLRPCVWFCSLPEFRMFQRILKEVEAKMLKLALTATGTQKHRSINIFWKSPSVLKACQINTSSSACSFPRDWLCGSVARGKHRGIPASSLRQPVAHLICFYSASYWSIPSAHVRARPHKWREREGESQCHANLRWQGRALFFHKASWPCVGGREAQ